MNATIIKIGNSKGIRIPKSMLIESGIDKYVNIVAKKGEIRIVAKAETAKENMVNANLSEAALSKDWLNKEEDKAWQSL